MIQANENAERVFVLEIQVKEPLEESDIIRPEMIVLQVSLLLFLKFDIQRKHGTCEYYSILGKTKHANPLINWHFH